MSVDIELIILVSVDIELIILVSIKMNQWWVLLILIILIVIIIGIVWGAQSSPGSNATENIDANFSLSPAQIRADHLLNFQPLDYETFPEPPRAVRLLILTQQSSNPSLAQIHSENLTTYSQEHGYTLKTLNSTEPPRLKLERILAELQTEQWDYLLWLDPHTFINKSHWDLSRIYGAKGAKDIMIGRKFPISSDSPFCGGVFLLKNSPLTLNWIRDWNRDWLEWLEASLLTPDTPKLTAADASLNQLLMEASPSQIDYDGFVGVAPGLRELEAKAYRAAVSEVGPSLILNHTELDPNGFILHQLAPSNTVLASFRQLKSPQLNSFKYLIILTCTLTTPGHIASLRQNNRAERLQWYKQAQQRWNQDVDSNFEVVVVENSGDRFDYEYPNLKYVYLDTSHVQTTSKCIHEFLSIQHALGTVNVREYDYIIKITGRYHIPDFKMMLRRRCRHRSIQAIRQHNRTRCEIVGSRSDLVHYIFNPEARDHVEYDYTERLAQLQTVHILDLIPITRTAIGGSNNIVEVL